MDISAHIQRTPVATEIREVSPPVQYAPTLDTYFSQSPILPLSQKLLGYDGSVITTMTRNATSCCALLLSSEEGPCYPLWLQGLRILQIAGYPNEFILVDLNELPDNRIGSLQGFQSQCTSRPCIFPASTAAKEVEMLSSRLETPAFVKMKLAGVVGGQIEAAYLYKYALSDWVVGNEYFIFPRGIYYEKKLFNYELPRDDFPYLCLKKTSILGTLQFTPLAMSDRRSPKRGIAVLDTNGEYIANSMI